MPEQSASARRSPQPWRAAMPSTMSAPARRDVADERDPLGERDVRAIAIDSPSSELSAPCDRWDRSRRRPLDGRRRRRRAVTQPRVPARIATRTTWKLRTVFAQPGGEGQVQAAAGPSPGLARRLARCRRLLRPGASACRDAGRRGRRCGERGPRPGAASRAPVSAVAGTAVAGSTAAPETLERERRRRDARRRASACGCSLDTARAACTSSFAASRRARSAQQEG